MKKIWKLEINVLSLYQETKLKHYDYDSEDYDSNIKDCYQREGKG
jgi:hypothetical protein